MINRKERFLRDLFQLLSEARISYCVSRNADGLYAATASDVDLIVPRREMAKLEAIATATASIYGYQLIGRTWFTNLCLVYAAPSADIVRIDLDGELRWRIFEIANADTLLQGAFQKDGAMLISPPAELLVIADRLAWAGQLNERYKKRFAEILANETIASRSERIDAAEFAELIQSENSTGLRCRLILKALFFPSRWCRSLAYLIRDIGRIFFRFCQPPGIILEWDGDSEINWNYFFSIMSLAFPEQKSPLPNPPLTAAIMALFRGGIVVSTKQNSFAARVLRCFSRNRRYCFSCVPDLCYGEAIAEGITAEIRLADALSYKLAASMHLRCPFSSSGASKIPK